MSETGPFSFEIDVHGAHAVADRERLHPACMSDGEVDAHVGRLKECLDRVAAQMKQALKEQEGKPIV